MLRFILRIRSPSMGSILKSASRFVVKPCLQWAYLLLCRITKKTPNRVFFHLSGTRAGIISLRFMLLIRSAQASPAHSRVPLISSSNPFFQSSSPTALDNKKTPNRVFFHLSGTRAGIRTLDPLIKSQLL